MKVAIVGSGISGLVAAHRLHREHEVTLFEAADWIGELRGKGLMHAIETVQPGGIEPNAAAAAQLLEGAKERGLLIGKGGLYGNVLRLAPMLNVSEAEMDEGCDILVDTISSITG